jgi:hypothetical protein
MESGIQFIDGILNPAKEPLTFMRIESGVHDLAT